MSSTQTIETFGPKYLGRIPSGERVWVTAEIRQDMSERQHQTVGHGTVVGPLEISFQGHASHSGLDNASIAGKIVETLRVIDRPAPGVTSADIAALANLWERWHLNTLKAGCAHQTVVWENSPYGRRPSLTETLPCPKTGYRYGTAWLVEPLDGNVIDQVRALFA